MRFVSLLALVAVSLGLPGLAAAQTTVPPGNLVGNQTWTAAGSPYLLSGDLTVPTGTTLTLEAGTTIRFAAGDAVASGVDTARAELRVDGTLLAQGTAMAPVTLESSLAMPAAGSWYGIVVLSGGSATLAGLSVRHHVAGLRDESTNGARLSDSTISGGTYGAWVSGAATLIERSVLTEHTSYGLWVRSGGGATLSGGEVRANGSHGIYADDGNLTLRGVVVRGNTNRGVYARSNVTVQTIDVDHSTFYGNPNGLYAVRNGGTQNLVVRNSAFVSNGTNGLYASGTSVTLSNSLSWGQTTNWSGVSVDAASSSENPLFVDAMAGDLRPTSRSPLRTKATDGSDIGARAYDGVATPVLAGHLFTNTVLTQAGSPYDVVGDLTIERGVTLTIEPGTTLRFAAQSDLMGAGLQTTACELRVEGVLVADGTLSLPIRFVSGAATPAPGDWYGIVFTSLASDPSLIDNAEIDRARYGVRSETPTASAVTIQRTTIRNTQSYGAWVVGGGSLTVRDALVRDSGSYGLYFDDGGGTVERTRVMDAGSRGIYARSNSRTVGLSVLRSSFVGNSGGGVYLVRNSGSLNVSLRDNVAVSNGSYGYYNSGASVSASHNLAWDQTTDFSGVTRGANDLVENPLFVDVAGRDLRPTSHSPLRLHASTGGTIGALEYDGVATVGVQGHIYADTTWTGTIDVLGDVTVEPGVTLSVEAGTDVRFAALSDSMRSQADTGRSELIVSGRLVVDGAPTNRVRFRSAGATPARGDWYGIVLARAEANTAIEDALVEYARYGFVIEAGPSNTITRTEVRESQSYGAWIRAATAVPVLDGLVVHDNGSYGIYLDDGSVTLRNLLAYANGSRGVYARSNSGTRTVLIEHATIHGNTDGVYAVRNGGTLNVTVRNSIIASNRTNGLYSNGASFIAAYNDVWGQPSNLVGVSPGNGQISADPQLVNPAIGVFQLLPSSLAIDAADAATALDHDATGAARPIDGDSNMTALPDMGAYEFNPSANRWPFADAGPDRVVESGVSAAFSASGSSDPDGTIVSYVWDFGDGSPTASGVNVSHTFSGGTDRVVTLTVTDDAGAIDIDRVNVEVNLAPVAEAGPDRFADPGESVTFSGAGSSDADGSITSYVWNFGDGSQATGVTVTHQYAQGGNYTVTLTVTDDDGSSHSDTATARVTGGGGGDTTPPSIVHSPVANQQVAGRDVAVGVEVVDNVAVGAVRLSYRVEGATAFQTVAMSRSAGNVFIGTIPGAAVALPAIEYWIQADDSAMPPNQAQSPATAPTSLHRFTVVPAGPRFVHAPVGDGQPYGQAVSLVADVSAPDGIDRVTIFHRPTGAPSWSMGMMSRLVGDTWQGSIPAGQTTGAGVQYYLEAVDRAGTPNTARLPATAPTTPYAFTVAAAPGPSITHTPPAGGQAFGQPVTLAASITAPAGLASASVFYRSGTTGAFTELAMTNLVGDAWQAAIPGTATRGAVVEYYLSARDSATPPTQTTSPSGAPNSLHAFTIANPTGPTIVHTPVPNGQRSGMPVAVRATVTAPAGIGAVVLSWRRMGGGAFTDVAMSAGAMGLYSGEIPAAAATPGTVEYYLTATDAAPTPSSVTSPPGSGAVHAFTVVAADPNGPTIVHTPIANGREEGAAVPILARVTDATGVADVVLFYRLTGSTAFAQTTLTSTGGASYRGSIPGSAVGRPGVEYYLRARDTVTPPNTTLEPSAGAQAPHAFTVMRTFAVSVGDLVITEIMANPSGSEATAEWFEIHNPTARAIDLDGLELADEGSDRFTINAPGGALSIPAGGYRVFGRSTDMAANGGVTVDYVYAGFLLSNSDDEILIRAGGTIVDRVAYQPSWHPPREGVALALDPTGLDAASNDDAASWCGATTMLSGGDFGTPGRANDPCSAPADVDPPVVSHTPVGSGQPAGVAVTVTAVVTDASGLASVELLYRATGGSYASVPMAGIGADTWQAEIPSAAVGVAGVEYYLRAVDAASSPNEALAPSTAPATPYAFGVTATDTSGPAITHVPLTGPVAPGTALLVEATIADPSGVAGAVLAVRPPGGSWQEFAMAPAGGADRYAAEIPAAAVTVGTLAYYVAATDAASPGNPSTLPTGAPQTAFELEVRAPDFDGPEIVHTPIADGQPRGQAVLVQAMVSDPSGVAEVRAYFRAAGSSSFQSVALSDQGGGAWRGELPAALSTGAGADYYLEAVDASDDQNASRLPAGGAMAPFSFSFERPPENDVDGPAIVHTPIEDGQRGGFPVNVAADVTDPSGVAAVELRYRARGGDTWSIRPMVVEEGTSTWRAQIPGAVVGSAGVEYYLTATDASTAANTASSPGDAPASVWAFTGTAADGEGGKGPGAGGVGGDGGCACSAGPLGAGGRRGDAGPDGVLGALALLLVIGLRRRR